MQHWLGDAKCDQLKRVEQQLGLEVHRSWSRIYYSTGIDPSKDGYHITSTILFCPSDFPSLHPAMVDNSAALDTDTEAILQYAMRYRGCRKPPNYCSVVQDTRLRTVRFSWQWTNTKKWMLGPHGTVWQWHNPGKILPWHDHAVSYSCCVCRRLVATSSFSALPLARATTSKGQNRGGRRQ